MVILATAAITAAGVGLYKGGQAATEDLKKKVRRHTTAKLRNQERQVETTERQQAQQRDSERVQQMTAKERVERFKQSVPGRGGGTAAQTKSSGLFRKK